MTEGASLARPEHLRSSPRRDACVSRAPARSVFGELLALRLLAEAGGRAPALSLAHAEAVTRALRGALLRFAIDPPPAVLSGHEPDGRRIERPHAAFLALPGCGRETPRGSIGGLAIALPRDLSEPDRQAILLAAARWEASGARLLLGRLGALRLARASGADAERALGLGALTGPTRHWASLTPVALQRNPGDLAARDPAAASRARGEAERTVADACEHVGLPRPAEVRISRRSPIPGVPPAAAFAPYPRVGSGLKRVCVHVEVRFEEEVAGPVLIGAGRYFGVGVCARNEPRP
jgi:CRISPR-associated protein Csb2